VSESVRDDAVEPGSGPDAPDLPRAVLERLDRSADWLRDPSLDPAWVVHEVRKDLKRVRALLRLVAPAAPTRKAEKDCAAAARELSGLRDADALLETLDRLAARAKPGEETDALAGIRAHFAAQRGSFDGRPGLPAEIAGSVAGALDEVARGLRELSFEAVDDALLDEGLAASRAQARRAWRRVKKKPSPKRMHELRKAVKRESYQRELCGRPFDRMDRVLLKKLADVLGELQDLEVLRATLRAEKAWRGPVRRLAREARDELKGRTGRLAAARYGEPDA